MAWSKGDLAVAKKSKWVNSGHGVLFAGYDSVPRKGGVYRVEKVLRDKDFEFLLLEGFKNNIFISSAFEKLSPATTEFSEMVKGLGGGAKRREKEKETA